MIRRVAVLGSSISMIVRPAGGLSYPRALERILNEQHDDVWLVDNLSKIAATIDDLPGHLPRLVADRPEVIVIHYGHVEPIRRPHSRAEWHRTYGVVVGSSSLDERVRRARRRFAMGRRRLGILEQWTPLGRFERLLRDCLVYLRKETSAGLVVVEANPAGPKIEAWGPGSTLAVERCNDMMRSVAQAEGATWLALAPILGDPVADAIPDGTHFTEQAHSAVAEALAREIHRLASAR
jgi:GDSL-like lipase/acylhydrolase family protein